MQDRLAGAIARPDGELVPGPDVRWIGRRHGRRQDRRWARSWSPEQIANRLRIDFPDDDSMLPTAKARYSVVFYADNLFVFRNGQPDNPVFAAHGKP